MRALAGAIVALSGALLYGAATLAEASLRSHYVPLVEKQRSFSVAVPEGAYALSWVLALAGIAIIALDAWRGRGKGGAG